MSAIPPGAVTVPGAVTIPNAGIGAIIPQTRSIANIVAQVTIRESHRFDVVVTEHPVENGASISDHAWLRPSEVEIEIGWDGTQGNPADHLSTLLQLRAARQPFTVVTGKLVMPNMLIANISTVTDQRTNTSIVAIVRCRQINLVSTTSTTVAPIASNQNDQAAPAATTPSTSSGTESLKPAPQYTPDAGIFGTAGQTPVGVIPGASGPGLG